MTQDKVTTRRRRSISIVVPMYNVEAFVTKIIQTLKNEDYPELEVILVDDGSEDRTVEACRRQIHGNSRFRLLPNSHSGCPGKARNAGLLAAKGEYIAFVDADDDITAGSIHHINSLIDACGDVDIFCLSGREIRTDEEGRVTEGNLPSTYPSNEILSGPDLLSRIHHSRGAILNSSVLYFFRREFLTLGQLYQAGDVSISEDAEWTPRVIHRADRVAGSDFAYYRYIRRSGSLTAKLEGNSLKELNSSIVRLISYHRKIQKGGGDSGVLGFFASHIARLIFWSYFGFASSNGIESSVRRAHLCSLWKQVFSEGGCSEVLCGLGMGKRIGLLFALRSENRIFWMVSRAYMERIYFPFVTGRIGAFRRR